MEKSNTSSKKNTQPHITEEERKIFTDAMQNINTRQVPKQIHRQKEQKVAATTTQSPSAYQYPFYRRNCKYIPPNESITFHPTNDTRRLKQLLSTPEEDTIDLHGCTLEEAAKLLTSAFNSWQNRSIRIVRIIHGKGSSGHSVIKSHIPLWLRDVPFVLCFCSCLPNRGGTGATMVLLKKER